MKRTPLKRRTAIRKRSKRSAPSWKGSKKNQQPYRDEHLSCLRCERTAFEFGVILELHHILHGTWGRPDYQWNYAVLCRECHSQMHGMSNLEECLRLKRDNDPLCFDLNAVEQYLRDRGRNITITL